MYWKQHYVCLARLFKMGRLSLHCCHFTIWICNAPISRWPWSITPKLSCVILRATWIQWFGFGTKSSHLPHSTKSSQNMKLVEITNVQIFSFVENKHTFSTLNFMKNRLQNQINTHLDLCTWFYSQHFFMLLTFLTIKPLPSGKAKPITMSMNNLQASSWKFYRFFGRFSSCKEKLNDR